LSPGIFHLYGVRRMLEASLFVDESGEDGTQSKYYLLTLVLHEQSDSISEIVELYENDLRAKGLPDIPLHASPLMYSKDDYAGMDIQERKRLLQSFFTMLQHMPVRYHTFSYKKSEVGDGAALEARMKRDLVNFIFDNLGYLQSFDKVKIYYDDGQRLVTKALHDAVEYALSTEAVMYKDGCPRDYRLAQAADMICTLELVALRFESGDTTKTYDRFFGSYGYFKKNWLKKVRRKLL
jgi:hypothetical protein